MNLVQFLISKVFTVNGKSLDISLASKLPMNPQDAERITLNFDEYQRYFGIHNGEQGELASRWSGLFRDEIVETLYPNTAKDYARYLICLKLLEQHIFFYARPRRTDDGEPCFSEWEGFKLAKESYKPYVFMEDLS
jgi:hypothetical protein